MSLPLAIHSLTNYGHIWRFAIFFIATRGQFRRDDDRALVKAGAAAIAMGVMVEVEQAFLGRGHCRVRDLIPNVVGVGAGALLVALWGRMTSASRLRDTAP
jgi:VanZ family protein